MATNDLGELLVKLSADIKGLETGLGNAKSELDSFKNYTQSFTASLKSALAFAGIATGLYELLSSFKQFASASIEVGRSVELMRLATYGLAEGLGMSMGVVDHWVEKIRSMGLSAEASWKTVQTALKTGIDLNQLEPLINAIKNIAPLAGMSVNEAIEAVMRSIATGMPLALRNLEIPMALVRQLLQETGQDAEGVTKRFQMISDFITSYGNQMEGVAARVGSSFAKQANQLSLATQQAKEALFENFLKPMLTAITGEKIKVWSDLANWIGQNAEKLRELGTGIGIIIARLIQMASSIGKIIASNPEWAELVVTIWGGAKALSLIVGPLVAIGGAFTRAAAQGGLLGAVVTKLRALLLALVANPYVITITIVVSAVAGLKKLYEKAPEAAPYAMAGEAHGAMTAEQQKQIQEAGEGFKAVQAAKEEAAKPKEEVTAERIAKETEEATRRAMERMGDLTKGIGGAGGGGKGAEGPVEDLLNYLTQYLEAKRQLEIQEAQESYETFKAQQDKKKAELEKDLDEGKISGQEYYQALKNMAQEETDQALKLIEVKIAKEKEYYAWAQKELQARAEAGEISPEALDLAQQKLEAEHRTRLTQLEGEALREKIKLEKESVDLLKQEYDNRKSIEDALASGREEAALGVIAEKDAEINRLLRERKNQLDELSKKGITPNQLAEFNLTTQLLINKKKFGEDAKSWAQDITQTIHSALQNALFGEGKLNLSDLGRKLGETIGNIFLKEALKPIEQALTTLFAWLREALSTWFSSLFGSPGGTTFGGYSFIDWAAQGGAYYRGVKLFGSGGIVTAPTLFRMADGLGLMGESGYEAVMPLTRIGGDLGVRAIMPRSPVNVIVNNNSPNQVSVGENSSGDLLVTIEDLMTKVASRPGKFTRALSEVTRVITR